VEHHTLTGLDLHPCLPAPARGCRYKGTITQVGVQAPVLCPTSTYRPPRGMANASSGLEQDHTKPPSLRDYLGFKVDPRRADLLGAQPNTDPNVLTIPRSTVGVIHTIP
jgi:hypothetical protein